MTAAISGSNGFIGTRLNTVISQMGIRVIPIPRYLLTTKVALKQFLFNDKIDFIFHLASYGNHYNQTENEEILKANVFNLFNLLEASKDLSYNAFVNFSTSSVLLPIQTMYSATKLSGELLVKVYAKKYDKPIMSIRPASVYGEEEADFRLIPKVIHNLLTNNEMEVVLEPKHDWIYVDDFIKGMLKLANKVEYLKGEAVNVSTGIQTSNEEVIRILEKIHGSKLKLKKTDNLRSYDTTEWQVDNRVLKTLNWKPEISLEEGLKRVYEYKKAKFLKQIDEK